MNNFKHEKKPCRNSFTSDMQMLKIAKIKCTTRLCSAYSKNMFVSVRNPTHYKCYKGWVSKTTQKFFYSIVLVQGFFARILLKSPQFFRKTEKNHLKETKKPNHKNFFEKHRVLESNKCCKVGGVGLFCRKMLLCNICNMWHFPV